MLAHLPLLAPSLQVLKAKKLRAADAERCVGSEVLARLRVASECSARGTHAVAP